MKQNGAMFENLIFEYGIAELTILTKCKVQLALTCIRYYKINRNMHYVLSLY